MDYLARRFDERTDPRDVPARRRQRRLRRDELLRAARARSRRRAPRPRPRRALRARRRLPRAHQAPPVRPGRLDPRAGPRLRRRAAASTPRPSSSASWPPARASAGSARTPASSTRSLGSWLLLGEVLTTIAAAARRAGHRPLRHLHALPRRLPDRRDHRALPARRQPVHLVPHDRAPRRRSPASSTPRSATGSTAATSARTSARTTSGAGTTSDPALRPRFPTGTLDVREVMRWADDEYRAQRCADSAMKRVKLPGARSATPRIVAATANHKT